MATASENWKKRRETGTGANSAASLYRASLTDEGRKAISDIQSSGVLPGSFQSTRNKAASSSRTSAPALRTERADELDKLNLPSTARLQRYGLGNIDLTARPVLETADGGYATVRSMSFYDEDEKKEILVPTIAEVGGTVRQLTDEEARARYYATGQNLGKFDSAQQATAYAKALHEQQQAYYAPEQREARKYLSYDVERGKRELARLQQQLTAEQAKPSTKAASSNSRGRTGAGASNRRGGDAEAMAQIENSIRTLSQEIARAEQTQQAQKYAELSNKSNFRSKAKEGAAKKGNVVSESRSKTPDTLAEAEKADPRYRHMTDEEVNIYNYLYATDEKEAKQYLKFIEESLNYRSGTETAQRIRGIDNDAERAFLTAIYGVGAGLDQFASGAAQLVSPDRRATSAGQFGSAYIREDLGDAGPRLPEALGGASLAQVGYDALTTSANMAPSILLSTLTGGLGVGAAVAQGVGAATLGASAAGNAYSQALAEGYGKGEARLYSTLIGASEACLQNVLGGIGALGGMSARTAALVRNIDSSLLRISSNVALNMLAEGTEEYLQDILEPVFRNMVYGENNETPLWTPEATYSFLLGALTAGLVEGPNTVRTGVQMNRDGAKLKANHLDENLIQVALRLGKETEAYQTAKKIKARTLSKTTHNIGELFYQYAADGGDMSVFDSRSESYSRMMELAKRRDGGYNNTREGTQTASTESPATTAYLALDGADKMGLLGARRVGAAVEKLLAGDTLSDSEVKVLNLESAAKRGVFNQLTGLSLDESVNKLWSSAEGRAQVMEQIENGLAGQREQRAQNDISGTQELLREQIAANAAAREMNAVGGPASVYDPATVQTSAPAEEQGITLESFAEQYRSAVNPEASDQEVRDEFAAFLTSVYGPEEAMARLRGATMTQEGNSTPTASEGARSAADVPTDAVIHLDGQEVSLGDLIALNAEYAAQGQSDMTEQQIRDIFAQQYRAENSKEGMNDGGEEAGMALRDGEPQRADSVPAAERAGRVSEGAGEAASGRDTQRARAKELRDSVKNAGTRLQSAGELGVEGGTSRTRARVVPETLYTDELRQLQEEFAAKGVTVHFFTGYLNIENGTERGANVRGAINGDFTQMWVKADHPTLTARQLALHEEFHRLKGENPQLLADTARRIVEGRSKAELRQMIERYVEQYGWTNVSDDYVLEEICADAYGGIDVFSGGATTFTAPVQGAVEQLDETDGAARNPFRERTLGREARRALKRMQKGEVLRYEELLAIPEIAEAMAQESGPETASLPNREKVRANALIRTLNRGSYSGTDANGNALYEGKVKRGHRMDIVIGLPGSGKSSVYTEGLSAAYQSRVSDVDDVRAYIPEYDGTNAARVHAEAKAVSVMALDEMLRRGDNIVLSVVGNDAAELRGKIQQYNDYGYKVYLHLNELPNDKAINRVVSRYLTEGRWVPLGMVREFGDAPTQVYLELTGQKGAEHGQNKAIEGRTVVSGRGQGGRRSASLASQANAEKAGGAGRAGDRGQGISRTDSGDGAGNRRDAEKVPDEAVGRAELAGYDRYSNDVGKGQAPILQRDTSAQRDTYERVKRAREQAKKSKFSTETTEAEYTNLLDAVVSFMDEHDLYVPQAIKQKLDSIWTADKASEKIKNAIFGTDAYDVYEELWDDEKDELNDMIKQLETLENIGEKETALGYKLAVHNAVLFMQEHGMYVPESVINHDQVSPTDNVSKTLENSFLEDPAYLELGDEEDDQFQALLDEMIGYELDATLFHPGDGSAFQYADGVPEAEDFYSEEEIMSIVASIEASVNGESAPDNTEGRLQEDREGFTATDTPNFRRWFHDDSGKLTLPDGRPKVLLSGGARMGRTSINFDWHTKSSPGFWATEIQNIADGYARGTTSHTSHTLMDAVLGHQRIKEVPLRNARDWTDAANYVSGYWHNDDSDIGLRVVPVDQNGAVVSDAEQASAYALQSNLTSQQEYNLYGAFANGEYTTLAVFENSESGLEQFNRELGDAIDEIGAGIRGWIKVYGSAKNTLLVECAGSGYSDIPLDALPEKVAAGTLSWSRYGDETSAHVNDITRHAFELGYDCVIFEDVSDDGGIQTQYAFRESNQIKSVYNSGDWSGEETNFKFSEESSGFVQQFDEEHGEGSAQQLLDALRQLRETYGPLRESAGSVREAGLPARTEADNKVSRSAATVAGAEATPENRVLELQQAVVDGKMSYVPIENKITANKAKNRLKLHGWTDSVRAWTDAVEQGRADADLVAMGATLLNNAGNSNASAEEYLDLLTNYAQLLRNAGQAVQAAKILQRMTPEGRLYGIERAVRKINERQGKGFDPTTGEFEGIQLDPALVEAFRNAQTEEERNEIIDQMAQDVANKMRTTNMERFTAWRYLNMLGNFRTQVRNVLGNAGFQLPRMVKDSAVGIVEAALEHAGVSIERTSSVARDAETWRAAGEIFQEYQDAILAGGKYQDNAGVDFGGLVNEKRRIFGNTKYKAWNKTVGAALEKYRTTTNWAMDEGDAAFCSFTFRDSLSRFMAANHTTWAEASEELQTRAVNKAIRDAAEATYRDNNALSTWLAGLARSKSTPQVVKTIAEGVLPFRKTPANILMRAYEYSPLSIIGNTVTDIQAATGRRSVGANEIVEQWAKTFTGTGLVALGYALASMGALIGKAPDDEKEKTLFEQQGYQAYALMAGGHTYTLDWLAPECIPLFLGANLQQAAFENGLTLQEGMNAVMSIGDPILEMSMLQGVNDALENAATYGNDQALVSFVTNALWSYATQGMTNTLVGQLERASANTRMQTYVDKNGNVPTTLQRGIGKTSAKVPGWDYNQIPYIDAWGDVQQNADSETWNAITQLFSPSYVSTYRQSDTLRELERLYDATGEAAVILDVAPKYFNVGNERKDLTPNEYVMYAVTRGQAAKEAMAELMESESYRNLSDEEKVTAVKRVYDYANQQGKAAVSDYKPDNWAVNAKENADRLGISVAAYTTAYSLTKETTSIKDRNGETVTNSKSLRIMQQLYALPELSEEQAKTLGTELGVSKTVLGYSKKMVENKLSAMERKYAAFN